MLRVWPGHDTNQSLCSHALLAVLTATTTQVRAARCLRLGQALAAPDASDGRGADRPCVDPARSAALPRAAVAAARAGV